jgi:hypothetical protein
MVVQSFVRVWRGRVAICAVDLVLVVHADRDRFTGDVVSLGLMAIGAHEIKFAHMDVIGTGMAKRAVEVAVFTASPPPP